MPAYQYSALAPNGRENKGVIEADSAKQARQKLRSNGLNPMAIEQIAGASGKLKNKKNTFFSTARQRMSVAELALATRQLSTMSAAGIPLEEAILSVAEQSDKRHVKSILTAVRTRVLEGYTLADSMADFPKVFPSLYCATVAAGEKTGRLDLVLERLADFTEQQHEVRKKIIQATIYPALIVLASILIVSFLLSYVVPKMVGVFQQSGEMLPSLTRVLISISNFIKADGLYLLILLIIALFVWTRLLKRERIRFAWHQFLMRLPVIGNATKLINTARFSHTLSILSNAGVDVLEAMKVSTATVSNLPIRKSLILATKQVREGVAIHRALKETGYFLPMSLHLIASGESSGKLEEMLARTAAQQEKDVEATISLTLTLFEPFIILVMGGVVLFIVLAVLLPIFDLDQFVQ